MKCATATIVTKTTFSPEKTITLLWAFLDGNKHDGRQKQKVTSLYTYTHVRARARAKTETFTGHSANIVSLTPCLSLSHNLSLSHTLSNSHTHTHSVILSLSYVSFSYLLPGIFFIKHYPNRSIHACVWFSRSLPWRDSRPWPFFSNVLNKNTTPKSRWTTGHRTICILYYDNGLVDSILQLKSTPCTSRRRNEFEHNKPCS